MAAAGCVLVLLATTIIAACANENDSATGQVTVTPTMADVGPTGTPPERRSSLPATDVEPTVDAAAQSADVLAAAVRHRVDTYASGYYTTLFLIDRVGRYSPDDGYITDWVDGRAVTAKERAAIATALEPRTVTWISHWRDVMGDPPSDTLPDRHAVVLVANPRSMGRARRLLPS